jgi:hypothetical protein
VTPKGIRAFHGLRQFPLRPRTRVISTEAIETTKAIECIIVHRAVERPSIPPFARSWMSNARAKILL